MEDLSIATVTMRMPTYLKDRALRIAKAHKIGLSEYIRTLIGIDYGEWESTKNSIDYSEERGQPLSEIQKELQKKTIKIF